MDNDSLLSYLSPGETLLWSGAPARKFRFERKHLPILFFVLPFLVFMSIPLIGLFAPDKAEQQTSSAHQVQAAPADHADSPTPPKKIPLAGRIFLGFFFLCIFGCFAIGMITVIGSQMGWGALLQGKTAYAVTNQRLIVVTGKKNKVVQSIHLGTITDIRMKEWPDGLGTIGFGPEPAWPYTKLAPSSVVAVENIQQPREVFQMIIQARKSA